MGGQKVIIMGDYTSTSPSMNAKYYVAPMYKQNIYLLERKDLTLMQIITLVQIVTKAMVS